MDFDRCSKFIKEVREDRYGKVKDRQVRKFHNLINKSKNNNNTLEQVGNAINNRLSQGSNPGHSDSHNYSTSNQSAGSNNSNSKWVINLSKTSLPEGQKSILAKGPNFSLTPKYIPNVDYIAVVESMCSKLWEDEAIKLRTDINVLLRKSPKSNLTKEERINLAQLKKDKNRVILAADKGMAMVVMDKEEYVSKAQELLAQPVYRSIPSDPTNKIKVQVITKLRRIKRENNLDEGTYKAMHPTGCIPPKFYRLSKIHKTGNPLRPIVSSRGSVTYGEAKVLSKVLKPLVGKSPHYIQSTGGFVSKAKGLTLQLGEY